MKHGSGTPLNAIAAAALYSFMVTGCVPAVAGELPRVEDFDINLHAGQIAAARADYIRSLSALAYVWGIPAFLNFRQATEFKQARQLMAPGEEPFGGWVLTRALSTPETSNALPNVDTLYGASYLRLDLQGPVVLEIPPIRDRYYSVAALDSCFNNIEVVGTRTAGQSGVNVLLAPPQWASATPPGIDRVVVMPTPAITLLQRIYVKNEGDIPTVRALQDGIRLSPLSGWTSHVPFLPIATPEYDIPKVREIRDPLTYFSIVSAYTALNPPREVLRSLTAQFNGVGLGPGAVLPVTEDDRRAIAEGARAGQAFVNAKISAAEVKAGWQVPPANAGRFSLVPLDNAAAQLTQIGLLPAEEAVYFFAAKDAAGDVLDGRSTYSLTLSKGDLPPVDPLGFWSLTMYRASDLLLVKNSIDRYVIRPDTKGLTFAADGSLTIYVSAERPAGVPEGNWLPAPAEPFQLGLRTYLPQVSVRDGSWAPPGLVRR